MIIEDTTESIPFANLASGDCFRIEGHYYIKAVSINNSLNYYTDEMSDKYFAVNLETGVAVNIDSNVKVIHGKFIVE